MDEDQIDPRALEEGICGITRMVGRFEFICVAKVHGDVYQTRKGPKFSTNPKVDQHYMVNKWPHRKRES